MEFSADIGALVAQGRQAQRARRYDEALACFTRALALDPVHLEALGNRGSILGAMGRFAEALDDYEAALRFLPDHAMLLFNRANALSRLGRLNEALESYDRAVRADPKIPEIWNNRGNILRDLKQPDEAIKSYDWALLQRPDYARALYNRGNILWVEKRQIEFAWKDFEKAFALEPESDNLRGDLLHLRMHMGDWRDFDALKALVDQGVRAGRKAVGPFAYQAISESPADLKACSEIYAADRHPALAPLAARAWSGHRKIRIGYLCGEFRQQATSFLTAGLYEAHDKERFEIIAFDSGWSDGSPLRCRLEKAFDQFVDIARLGDEEAARRILAEEVDILVNLNGYFGENRMNIFARRPAPVQVNYLGFPATLGAPYIDYILADRIVIPEHEQHFYREKIAWLPDSYQANDSKRALPTGKAKRADHGLPEEAIVFCSFNQTYKLTSSVFASWMRILREVPGSLLWLLEGNAHFPNNIRREAEQAGIAADRVLFAPMMDWPDHLARMALADIFLDTAPYNSHTTGSDALWAGLPLITCRGSTFPGRVAESLLAAMNLPELVADDMTAYEALAVKLVKDPALLQASRQKLESNRRTAPLFDTARFARHVEAAYRTMWEISQADQPPRSFAVTEN
jgi:predicted O-linked N-acetylglucosamine transferase (SPINDLY family)